MKELAPFEHLEKELKSLHGKVFIGWVHQPVYGPLRNLNFILEGLSAEEIENFLLNGFQPTHLKIWEHTMLQTYPMVLPWEMVYTSETKPKVCKSIKEAESHILQTLEKNKARIEKDKDPAFFYRLGIY
jgi:hypothetical protein